MSIFNDALLKRFIDSTAAVAVTSLDTLLIYDNETELVYKVPVSVLTAAFAASAPVQSVAGKTGTVTLDKTDVGLSNVDNTLDVNKPVSTAQQTAFDDKVSKSTQPVLTSQTITTSAIGGLAAALPTLPTGYWNVVINGVTAKIPYY